MNKVEAIIRPEKLNDVKEALVSVGLVGLNVVNVTGRGAQRGVTTGGSRGVGRYEIDMLPKMKLELVVHDDATQQAIDTIVCLLYTSPSPRDGLLSRMPSSA